MLDGALWVIKFARLDCSKSASEEQMLLLLKNSFKQKDSDNEIPLVQTWKKF